MRSKRQQRDEWEDAGSSLSGLDRFWIIALALLFKARASIRAFLRRPRRFREIVAHYGKPLILGGITLYVAACTYAAAPNEFVLGAQLGTAARGAWEVGKIILGRG